MLSVEQQIKEQIEKNQNILIVFGRNWGGDAVSSALALFLFLAKMGKNADIAAEKSSLSPAFDFLPSSKEIKTTIEGLNKFVISLDLGKNKLGQLKYKVENNQLNFYITAKSGKFTSKDISTKTGDFKYDLIITLDTEDLDSFGKIYSENSDFFFKTPIINIDHGSGNENYGQINHVDILSVSTTEIIFKLISEIRPELMDQDIATCLLAGMIAETKSFKTANVSPATLSTAAQLMSLGARREEIVNKFYRSRSLNLLKLWGRALAKLSGSLGNSLIWTTLAAADFEKTETNETDLLAVVDELIVNVPQAKMIVIFYETEVNGSLATKIAIYSFKNIDALAMSSGFNPRGTKNLAKITSNLSVEEAKKQVLGSIEPRLAKLLENS